MQNKNAAASRPDTSVPLLGTLLQFRVHGKHKTRNSLTCKKTWAYIGLFFVVFIWGVSPLLTYELNKQYSPTFKVAVTELILVATYLLLCGKRIKFLNKHYIKAGCFTGVFLTLANLCQKIGLLFSTPAKYAFLENLTCVAVPVLLYFFVRKKPTVRTVISCVLCLSGVFVLNGVSFTDGWGIGEILCGLAGILYGVNIAGTACFAKNLYTPLYLAIQSIIGCVVSVTLSLIFHYTAIEPIEFRFDFGWILLLLVNTLVSSALCWIIRTNSLKHISVSIVSVIMPFSAVITAIASVLLGTDALTIGIVAGGILIVSAIILSD